LASSVAVVSSLDCDRDVTTIEPLVSGQQFMTPLGAGVEGVVSRFKSEAGAGDRSCEATALFVDRLALQQACPSIDIEPAIAWSNAPPTATSSVAVARA
jgi:hypothetical protein